MAGGDNVLNELDVHASETALLAITVEYADEVYGGVTAFQRRSELAEIKRVRLDHFRHGTQVTVAVGMTRDDAALITAVTQPTGKMPADKT